MNSQPSTSAAATATANDSGNDISDFQPATSSSAPSGTQESVSDARPNANQGGGLGSLLNIAGDAKKPERIGDTSAFSRFTRRVKKHTGKAQKLTVGQVMDKTSRRVEDVTAHTTATMRGITEGATGVLSGTISGLMKGSKGLMGRKSAFLAGLANSPHTPMQIGSVAAVKKVQGTPIMQFRLTRALDGSAYDEPQITEPTACDSYRYTTVNFDGEEFDAMCIDVKDDGRTVAFMFIDDRNGAADAPVYLVPLS